MQMIYYRKKKHDTWANIIASLHLKVQMCNGYRSKYMLWFLCKITKAWWMFLQ